jgi:hypothetical protein
MPFGLIEFFVEALRHIRLGAGKGAKKPMLFPDTKPFNTYT